MLVLAFIDVRLRRNGPSKKEVSSDETHCRLLGTFFECMYGTNRSDAISLLQIV